MIDYKKITTCIIKIFADALFPGKCLTCGTWINDKHNIFLTADQEKSLPENMKIRFFLCELCLNTFIQVKPPFCLKCGIMFKSHEADSHICGKCLKAPGRFSVVRAFGVYDKTLMMAIHYLKYKGKIQLARPLGLLLFLTFIKFWQNENIDLILPVPLHKKRLKNRGFNQGFLLVRHWPKIAKLLNIEYFHPEIKRDLLARNRWTTPQTKLKRKERIENIKGAFTLSRLSSIKNKNILLVDDVFTTGATVDECAKVLLQGGAANVDVLVLAQTA